jgi:hypothetical protein
MDISAMPLDARELHRFDEVNEVIDRLLSVLAAKTAEDKPLDHRLSQLAPG